MSFDKKKWRKAYYLKNRNTLLDKVFKYRRTFRGLLIRIYEKMKGRVKKGWANNPQLYIGKFLPKQEDFMRFVKSRRVLKRLYKEWARAGYPLSLRPTPHRKNDKLGYELFNVTFMTFGDNIREAVKLRKERRKRGVN